MGPAKIHPVRTHGGRWRSAHGHALGSRRRRRSNTWPHPWGPAYPSGGHSHGGRHTRPAAAHWAPARSPWPHPWDLGAAALCEREGGEQGSGGSRSTGEEVGTGEKGGIKISLTGGVHV
jgi:hypothetical protein